MPGPQLIFDKYELVRRLAVGGMGEVFVARQVSQVSRFERYVILKSLLPDLALETGFVEQFLDEARVVATLNHPHVVSVFEVGVSHGTYYLAMEFIPGMNLSQLRRASTNAAKAMPPLLAARIIADAALGLHHAHSAKDVEGRALELVHRDISPHNIMVREDGLTKVVDFGIASATNRSTRTRTGVVKGKLAYMSPEQLSAHPLDGRSDQFSLGIVLWELLTGVRLFVGENDAKVAEAVLRAPIAAPSKWNTPAALDAIVMKMLERDPQARFANCELVARELDGWLKEHAEPSDHAAVAAWMKEVASSELAAVNLTTPDDFVLKLRSQGSDSPVAPNQTISLLIEDVSADKAPKGRRRLVAGLVGAVVALAAGVGAWSMGWWSAPISSAVVDAGVTVVAAPVVVDAGPGVVAVADVPRVRLSVASRPAHARLQVDGEWLGEAPQTVQVAPFEAHRFRLELDGYKTVTHDVPPADAGVLLEFEVPLVRLGAGKKAPVVEAVPAAGQAFLSVRSEPSAVVFLDGTRIGTTTLFKHPTRSGKHVVELEAAGRPRKTITVVLEPDETRKIDLKL